MKFASLPLSARLPIVRPAGSPGARLLAFFLAAAVLAACTKSPHEALQNSYRQDAHQCRVQNPVKTQTRVNVGGVTDLQQTVGVDTAGYLKCMQRLGYRQDVKTDPLLKAFQRCRTQATRTRAVTASGTQIGTTFDENAYRACMKQRGFEGEVNVGPLGNP
jgi:hypothetical protein